MAWFAIFESVTGRLESVGTVVASDEVLLAKGLEKLELAFDPRDPTKQWNESTKTFDTVVPPRLSIPTQDFLARFTASERDDIFDAARNHANATVRKQLQSFLDWLKIVEAVQTDDAYLSSRVNALESVGLIGVGRAAEILV